MTAQSAHLDAVSEAATALYEARRERRQIARISETFGIHIETEAYEVASMNIQRRMQEGAKIVGRKIGLTSKAVQKQLGVDQPDYGILLDTMELLSGATIDMASLVQPKAEAEIALVADRDIDREGLSWGQFLTSIAYALPAIEIVDSVIENWSITLADTIADNASCGSYVLGLEPRKITDVSLIHSGMALLRNGAVAATGSGAACLDSPLLSAYWLACKMIAGGNPIRAGEVVLTGALGPMIPLGGGDRIEVEIGGVGSVRCQADGGQNGSHKRNAK
ncbi:fumarylacetoacetate hydrolase family protein [Caballeronia sp. dw_19]|uniref:2-keto-4-pentenoate hydratase n=1 Tax=Caballeronia sp. dw_19 TaxID=2719791 RepID=UPI001BD5E975|nr:fumarylacetoacetate hydrolase family protein [Caballeronia sp. dw_19]